MRRISTEQGKARGHVHAVFTHGAAAGDHECTYMLSSHVGLEQQIMSVRLTWLCSEFKYTSNYVRERKGSPVGGLRGRGLAMQALSDPGAHRTALPRCAGSEHPPYSHNSSEQFLCFRAV